ncbi:MAG: hypothetical protein Q9164_004524 [Protoblastenia rupestris]
MGRSLKKPFQQSISSYFDPVDNDELSTPPSTKSSACIGMPVLPIIVQSSLLNVGMRVRKSIPEGNKTKRRLFSEPTQDYSNNLDNSSSSGSSFPNCYHGLRPYCGLFRVGGESPQVMPAEEDLPPLHFDNESWSLSLPSSLQSYTSIVVTDPLSSSLPVSNDKKRRREDADDEDLGLESQPVSPRSRPISHTMMPNLNAIRPIAPLKTSRKGLMDGLDAADGITESEMIDIADYGDAPVFRPEEWERPG